MSATDPSADPGPERPFRLTCAEVPLEGCDNPVEGRLSWYTLVSGDRTPTRGISCGVAVFAPGDRLHPHRHAPPEVYFGLEGSGVATVAGEAHLIAPGALVYVPGDAEHAVEAGPQGLQLFYAFAVHDFTQIVYRFAAAAGAVAAPQPAAATDPLEPA